jgi:hypothetical protein
VGSRLLQDRDLSITFRDDADRVVCRKEARRGRFGAAAGRTWLWVFLIEGWDPLLE